MPTTTFSEGSVQRTVDVDAEGFLTDPLQWDEELARALAGAIGVDLTDAHWAAIRFARQDYADRGEAPTIRRLAVAGEIPTKTLFALFPGKPAKKLAYVAGLPKPRGCV